MTDSDPVLFPLAPWLGGHCDKTLPACPCRGGPEYGVAPWATKQTLVAKRRFFPKKVDCLDVHSVELGAHLGEGSILNALVILEGDCFYKMILLVLDVHTEHRISSQGGVNQL